MRLADQLDDVLRQKQLTAQLQQQQSWREFHSTDRPPTEEFVGSNLEEKRQINAFIWDSFEKTIEKREDGYYVRLPWKDNAHTLPHNKGMPIHRLQAIINKLKNDSTLLEQYEATIAQQLDQNIIEEVQETNTAEGPIVHYLAHHGVTTPNKETTQLRAITLRLKTQLKERLQRTIPEIRSMSYEPYITANEYELALRVLVRNHQSIYYPQHTTNVLYSLILYKDQHGVIRCKGRLGRADFPFDTREPILLMARTKLAEIIVNEGHLPYHCSSSQTMANVRKKFWIPKLRQMEQKDPLRCIYGKNNGSKFKFEPSFWIATALTLNYNLIFGNWPKEKPLSDYMASKKNT
ncbi:hypothetical protein DICVIV_13823 [Dictyocaulus viviparus]|uniref:Integrase zinc-binding domain-containing protein n=1 Tax=Dictyocaulus viviparus TaxID=29172 RepID=A0A0D8X6W0_DICVI|nr:hypothetical protein DICVIV_13823 [Dictyocaulus viviparus]